MKRNKTSELAGANGISDVERPPAEDDLSSCSSPEDHQFDFWVGEWDVFGPEGQLIAHSKIEKVYGRAIRENWMPLNGQDGGSLSIYVLQDMRWEQFWVDSQGMRAIYTGNWDGKAMVIAGKLGGVPIRMSYSANADGSVRQLGERSTDDGKTWEASFDFTYRPSVAKP